MSALHPNGGNGSVHFYVMTMSQAGIMHFMGIQLKMVTWVLSSSALFYEADDEQDDHQQSNGAHQSNEPALGGNVHLFPGERFHHTQ